MTNRRWGGGDIQSLADLGTSFAVVRAKRAVPILDQLVMQAFNLSSEPTQASTCP
jgi:hypothetical protein